MIKAFLRLLGGSAPSVVARSVWLASILMIWAPGTARAQVEGQVSVQRFDPAPGQNNLLTTRGVRTEGHLLWTAALMANYGFEPLRVTVNGESFPVVENLATADFYGSLVIIDQLQVALKVPVTYAKGIGLDEDGERPLANDAIDDVAVGDIQAEIKGRFYGDAYDPWALGAYAYVTIPTAVSMAPRAYLGNDSVGVGGAFVVDGMTGPFSYALNLGGMWREGAKIGATDLGAEMRASAAGGYQVSPVFRAVLDVFGNTNFDDGDGATNVEVNLAAQVVPLGSQFTFTAGGGAAVFQGAGGAAPRFFLGLLYDSRKLDADGDGIGDARDACPTDAEDRDGFEDADGCPDEDNDGDGVPDTVDQCKNEPEDEDGFADEDGCPDPDNDGDGLEDVGDLCPDEAETKNGFQDGDGCPDAADSDHDGVLDEDDMCKDDPEDTDGFEDTDGCPDVDNDQDGVPDTLDECPELQEDGQGIGALSQDGCPINAR